MSMATNQTMRTCNRCGTQFPETTEFFHRGRGNRGGLRRDCKGCAAKRNAAWHASQPRELKRARAAAWRARNRERARARATEYRNRPEVRERRRRWSKDYNPIQRVHARRRRYGVSPEVFAAMLNGQGGRCAACPSDGGGRTLHIDHDHKTGKVRGLLCGPCNRALGSVRDEPATLRALADYLDRSQKEA